ncbi:hypothetical protein NDN08_005401 [Rhodosorus marinus]|uniref:Large ribosomal subunit protein uL6 alpha-beta domain-containing protein n=1 Tax=Rhodosorus marinus TaxID=101924 RepID=A0AAV8V579_9RHOD|nr:hypothetical protein NDN08_005401 [Rhodosorus marinus]
MAPSSAPRTTLKRVLQMYTRKIWRAPEYLNGIKPQRKWRVPPVVDYGGKKDSEKIGTSVFFYPASNVSKRRCVVKGRLGTIEQHLPWTALDIVRTPGSTENTEFRYFADNGTASLVKNAFIGVQDGCSVVLELVGVGYRAEEIDDMIHLRIGFNRPIELPKEKDGILYTVLQPTRLQVAGVDKAKVHLAAATVRGYRKPDPYKGKGIRYLGEELRLIPGKKNQ